jgi:hypothetical protein
MSHSETYRRRADDVLREAEAAASPSVREVLCDIAEAYRVLAGNQDRNDSHPLESNPLAYLPLASYRFPKFKFLGKKADIQ